MAEGLKKVVSNRFRILSPVGAGGMGEVYEAIDLDTGNHVALKTLRFDRGEVLSRLKTEFRTVQAVRHTHLVELLELVQQDDNWYVCMELLKGTDYLTYVRQLDKISDAFGSTMNLAKFAPRHPSTNPQLGGECDGYRLRSVTCQVLKGLRALHEAGKIHRDMKPHNIVVRDDGHTTVLDFGLVGEVAQIEHEIVGTAFYMSPEQATAVPITSAADVYSVGVMLFQAITGFFPFHGNPYEVLRMKQTDVAPNVLTLVPHCDEDLAHLVDAMLCFAPGDRPSIERCLEVLEGKSEVHRQSLSKSQDNTFVGRQTEMDLLRRNLTLIDRNECRVVGVGGPSGIGKSTLLRHLSRELPREYWFIEGTSYERESSVYKGMDAAIDAITARLCNYRSEQIIPYLPPGALDLLQIFPVLGRIPGWEMGGSLPDPTRDKLMQRLYLFDQLREFFRRLTQDITLVLWLDDFHWAGPDAWAMLKHIVNPAQSQRLMVVCTFRTENDQSAWEERFQELMPAQDSWLNVKPLSLRESQEAVDKIGLQLGIKPEAVAHVAERSVGHPLFIDALMRVEGHQADSLDDALLAQLKVLEPAHRRVMDVLSLLTNAVEQEVVALTAQIPFSEFMRAVAVLRHARMTRSSGVRRTDVIAPLHDRFRTVCRNVMSPEDMTWMRRRLVQTLEAATRVDRENLAGLYFDLGEKERAAVLAEQVGDVTVERLAFLHAVKLYDLALAGSPTGDHVRLGRKKGDALVHGGLSIEAARIFSETALIAKGFEQLRLRQRASEQYLRSGYFEEGEALVDDVMRSVGEPIRKNRALIIGNLLVQRGWLKLRGYGFKTKPKEKLDEMEMLRIDAAWGSGIALASYDVFVGAEMQARGLIRALGAGDELRIARGLCCEATLLATQGSKSEKQALSVLSAAEPIVKRLDDPWLNGWYAAANGVIHFHNARWAKAEPFFREALVLFGKPGIDAHWEVVNFSGFLAYTYFYLGDWLKFQEVVQTRRLGFANRGDRFGVALMSLGLSPLAYIKDGDPTVSREVIGEAIYERPGSDYTLFDYYRFVADSLVALSDKQTFDLKPFEQQWKQFRKSLPYQLELLKTEGHFVMGCLLVRFGQMKKLDAVVTSLNKTGTAVAKAFAHMLESSRELISGREEAAKESAARAGDLFTELQMHLFAASARFFVATLNHDAKAVASIVEAAERHAGIKTVERFFATFWALPDSSLATAETKSGKPVKR